MLSFFMWNKNVVEERSRRALTVLTLLLPRVMHAHRYGPLHPHPTSSASATSLRALRTAVSILLSKNIVAQNQNRGEMSIFTVV